MTILLDDIFKAMADFVEAMPPTDETLALGDALHHAMAKRLELHIATDKAEKAKGVAEAAKVEALKAFRDALGAYIRGDGPDYPGAFTLNSAMFSALEYERHSASAKEAADEFLKQWADYQAEIKEGDQ